MLGAREQHVEAAVASGAVDGAEALHEVARFVGAVDRRDEDDIALVALDVLEVLDEERLQGRCPARPIALGHGVAHEEAVHLGQDQIALGLVEGDDAQRLVRVLRHKVDSRLDRSLGLGDIALVAVLAGDRDKLDPVVGVLLLGRGEHYEPIIVEVAVGERDERSVLGSIVPQEFAGRLECHAGDIEDR